MIKVITYGTYDLLHRGHIRLLERAKELGDYLIVGVTADDFDKTRGKINVQQSLIERVKAVEATGIADKIIIEEYEGQKINDIIKYDVDIFTVGSDWVGKFDYLKRYCDVVYLERTQGISSSELREAKRAISIGLVGDTEFLNKFYKECVFVNGIHVGGICTNQLHIMSDAIKKLPLITSDYDELLENVEAVYIRTLPENHYKDIKKALMKGKHVLCESPVTLNVDEYEELSELAKTKNLVFMEAMKTAYVTAYARLLLLLKGGVIGEITSVDATCTSLQSKEDTYRWRGIHEWGPTGLLPVLQILGTDYREKRLAVKYADKERKRDIFSKFSFVYKNAVASVKVGDGVKSEGELIISGTKGYVYVPAPWWKTDYFEIRYENQNDNRRYFYQLDGEGIRYEIVAFVKAVENGGKHAYIEEKVTKTIVRTMEEYAAEVNTVII